ncbi:MAG TPA: CARDB domain-containing protein [Pirellulaceae bacterium]|nr:CARDB domain-containing protein [Pirellulaceae bacterium]
MSRTAMVLVAGLAVVGCVVALLPAQESSRRTASKYRTGAEPPPLPTDGGPPSPTESAPTAPDSLLPPNMLPANLQQQLQAASQQVTQEMVSSPATPPAAFAPAAAQRSISDTPQPAASNTAQPAASNNAQPDANNTTQPAVSNNLQPDANNAASPAAETAPPAELAPPPTDSQPAEDGQLRSVLKRSRPPIVETPSVQPSSPPPAPRARPASSGGSSRRVTSTPAAAPRGAAGMGSISNNRSIQDLAVVGRSPGLRVEVAGPPGVTVGKPALYLVRLINESDAVAEEVVLRVALPGWVRASGSQASLGEAALHADPQGGSRVVWSLPEISPRSETQLKLQLVSSEGDGFDLSVEWTSKPAAVRASIIVKQPQLELSLAGPADMTFGEEKTFTLTVSNPGSGDAERVVVNVSSGRAPPQQIDVGSLPAGMKKDLPLTVVASQPGVMELRATAAGEGGIEAEAAGKVVVRKAELNVAVQGPPLKFAGTEATYVVTVANTGTAPAENVNLSLALPAGAKFLGGIDGASPAGGGLRWKIASLAAGTERTYEVRTQLASAGLNRLSVQAQSAAAGAVSAQAETQVEAVSELKLVVNDPSGPLPLGEQAVYEIQVMNRGSQAAQKVKIIMQFSDGVEPVAFDGCDARLVPGQVLCQPLVQLGAGEQVTLRVRAKGQRAGTHQFRVEVTSNDAGTRLVSEGTTRFFSESGLSAAAASTVRKTGDGVQR